jgi:sarcosine oxidase subunit alpha
MALVRNGHQRSGQQVQIPLADGRTVRATVGSTVFYDPEGKRHHV